MAAVVAAAPHTAAAQSASGSAASEPVRLGPISVTATRNPIPTFDYPGMVSVVSSEEIRLRQPSTADDLLKWVPGVEFSGGPRRTGEVPSIRGFSGADVVIMIDGARQNFDSGHDGRFFVDPSLLREVEVLRGSASALYGSGGTGGVIAFRTVRAEDLLRPGERYGASISTGYQSVNVEKHGNLTLFARPTDELDLVGSVTRRASGSIDLGDGSELDRSDDDIAAGLVKGGWRLSDLHRIEASFQRFDNQAQEPNNGQGRGDANLVEKDLRADNWRLAYGFHDPANDLVDLDLSLTYTAFAADELRLDGFGTGPQGELLRRDVDTLGFRLDNRSRLAIGDGLDVTFTYGVEAYRDEQDGSAGAGERDGVPDAEAEFSGLFGQAEFRLAEPFGTLPGELLLVPGVRFDRYASSSDIASTNRDDAVSPRLAASYLPNDWSMLFASYGDAFRAPTINELYLTGVHFRIPLGRGITNRFVASPDLKPQRTRTLEVGGGFDFDDVIAPDDRVQVKAAHFWIEGEDFIDLQVDQPAPFARCNPFIPGACDGTTRSVNVAEASLTGTEVEASYETRLVRVAFGASRINGENERTGAKLGSLAPSQFTVDTAVKIPQFDSVLGWRALAAARFDKVNTPAEARDGYAVHDLYLAWTPGQVGLDGLRLDLGIDNVFDKSYARTFTSALEPGRNYKVQLRYAFEW